MEKLNLGFRTFEVSKQAKVVFYAYIVIFVTHLLSAFVTEMEPIGFIVYTIFLAIMGGLSVYVANCIVVGQCTLYAWIVTYIYIGLAVFYVFAFLLAAWLKFFLHKKALDMPSRKTSSASKRKSSRK